MNLATRMVLLGTVASDDAVGDNPNLPTGGGTGGGGTSGATGTAGVTATSYPDGRISYHLGTLFDGTAPFHIGAYTVGTDSVPAHYWNSRWTNRTNPLAIVRTPAQIVAAHRMFPFGATGCNVAPLASRIPYTIMGSSNVTIYMPTTGERPDIGLVTDNGGSFMLGGSALPMLDWAQANDSCPLHFRDETTGKPINLITYPQANAYDFPGYQGSPWLDKGPPTPTSGGYHAYGGGWTPQQGHFCEMSYLAHMATRDLGFFENLQYNANFTVLCDASYSRPTGAIFSGELRGRAWALRNLFMAHIATVDVEGRGELPATCHPSSYWDTLLDNALAYYSPIMSDPAAQTFRVFGGEVRFGPWQVDYMLSTLAFGVLTGHSDWTAFYLWCLGNVIARTNGTSGYPPGWGGAYYLNTCPWVQNADGSYDQSRFDTAHPFTWHESFLFQQNDPNGPQLTNAQIAALAIDPLHGGVAITGNEYIMTTRAVLVMADYLDGLGLANVRGTYSDFDTCLTNAQNMFVAYGLVNPRVAVISP